MLRSNCLLGEAARMKQEAIASGDQPFGAVVVMGDTIIGYGPSRVVIDRNPNAHAERVALWDAQHRLGGRDVSGAVIYSTSRPCSPARPFEQVHRRGYCLRAKKQN
jgi:tRNA(adenine34) deaminase